MTQTNPPQDDVVKEGKIYAVVSYWLFLCILPLILKKDNKFAVYHGKQGLVLFIFLVLGFIFHILPLIGPIFYNLVLLTYLLASVWGTIEALVGNYCRIPIVSDIANKISL